MTVKARSDISSVSLSEAHGGCGQTHIRPVVNGAPTKEWNLTCPRCEEHLRSDPCWGSEVTGQPETPDEVASREDKQKRLELETTLTQQEANKVQADVVRMLPDLINSMPNTMSQALAQALAQVLTKSPDIALPEDKAAIPSENNGLSGLSLAELRAIAKMRNITIPSDKRDKNSILALLKAH